MGTVGAAAPQAHSQAKIPEGAKTISNEVNRAGKAMMARSYTLSS